MNSMSEIFDVIIDNRYTFTAVVLFVVGFANMMLQQNLVRKVIGFNIMDSATFLFLAARGYVEGKIAAVLEEGLAAEAYVNPIPAGLVLTGIVVSVSVSAFSFALIQRIYKRYGTVDMRELLLILRKEGSC